MKRLYTFFAAMLSCASIFSQEALKSTEEEYYDFLSLQGLVERPTLGYRTLSDSEWTLTEEAKTADENVWKNNSLGSKWTVYEPEQKTDNIFTRGIDQSVKVKIYGPEWFNSYNTAAPYGQNDGALWQGKGYNTSFTAGARLEAYGLEVTFKPQLSFSQNREFDYIKPNYPSVDENNNLTIYNGKADIYGYYGVEFIDAPQRFGDKAFFTYDWGDTEIRYTWHNLTAGVGTQTIWLGPAKLNPIIHSNNAPSYPKLDVGLRKTAIYMPYFGWNLGDIEARGWWGYLTESDYFDNDTDNDHNLISGLSINYAFPGFLDGLSMGFNRIMLSKWNEISSYSLSRIYIPDMGGSGDAADQRFSFTFDYTLPKAGFEVYLEWARNDFSPNMDYIIRYPFHTQAWTFGAQKAFNFSPKYGLKILLELSYLENSADYDRLLDWYTTFYCHGEITQGHTNKGQWLGAGIGTGGNSQYLGFEFFHPKGSVTLFGQRRNPDLDYTMYIDSRKWPAYAHGGETQSHHTAERNIRAMLDFGIDTIYFVSQNLTAEASIVFEDERNPLNLSKGRSSEHRYNFSSSLGVKYNF